jgi:HTH-type transcriptional regulator/antitoxin MqsA
MKEKHCPNCNKGILQKGTKSVSVEYKGNPLTLEQPGTYCTECDEGIITGTDMKRTEKQVHDFRAEVDGYLTSDEVRTIRTELGLTQHAAAEIFGGGPNAFSRYERGEVRQTRALDQLLRLLHRHPEHLQELEKKNAA